MKKDDFDMIAILFLFAFLLVGYASTSDFKVGIGKVITNIGMITWTYITH